MYMLVHLLLLGFSLCWVSAQEPNLMAVRHNTVVESSSEAAYQPEEEQDDSALTRLQNVTSLDDFIALLIKDGHPVTTGDIVSNYTDESGATYINNAGGGRLAVPDDCSPRDTTVRLTFDTADPTLVYFPRCTKIERCGGCCASPHLECVPSYTERVSYKVIKATVAYPGSSHLQWNGDYASVILDRHVHCRVQCTLTADKCGPKKEFLERQCECRCLEYERCQPPRLWDPEECECKCAEVVSCCKSGETCGLTFVKETCECGVDTNVVHIRNTGNYSQEDALTLQEVLNNSLVHTTATSTLPPTAAITTTTTASSTTTGTSTTETMTTTENDPCATLRCPPNFTKQRQPGGTCSCRPMFGRPRSRNTLLP